MDKQYYIYAEFESDKTPQIERILADSLENAKNEALTSDRFKNLFQYDNGWRYRSSNKVQIFEVDSIFEFDLVAIKAKDKERAELQEKMEQEAEEKEILRKLKEKYEASSVI